MGTDKPISARFTLAVAVALVAALAGVATAQSGHGGHELLYARGDHAGEAESWEFEGQAGSLVIVEASGDFDTRVTLHSSDGEQLGDDDDGGPGLHSRLVSPLPRDGRYRVEVTAVGGGSGVYTLTVRTLTARFLERETRAEGVIGEDRRVGIWAFDGGPDEMILVEAASDAFDTAVRLISPGGEEIARDDDSGAGTDSRLVAALRGSGLYRVLVEAFGGIGSGGYTVAVRPGTMVRQESDLLLVRGVFTRDRDESEWEFEGAAGEVVTVGAAAAPGDAVDTVLELHAPGGRIIAWDDDSGHGSDSRLMAVLPETGRYRIRVSNRAAVDTREAAYTVAVRRAELPLLVKGEATEGILRGGGYGTGTWGFEGTAGEVVTVDVMSEAFDTIVAVTSPGGETIAVDDDGGDRTNSRLTVSLTESGRHRIKVAALSGGEGAYIVRVDSREPAIRPEDLLMVRGVLNGEQTEWVFEATVGDVVTVDVTSEVFDTAVRLESCDRILASDDDGGPGRNARLVATLSRDESCRERRYRVVVRPSGGNGTGPYTLEVRRTGRVPVQPAGAGRLPRESTPLWEREHALDLGELRAGRLESRFGPTESWTVDGVDGKAVVVEAFSDQIDPVVTLASPCGERIARDDDGGSGLNPRLLALLPDDADCAGPYRVAVSAFRPGSEGEYTVRVRAAEVHARALALGSSVRDELESESESVGVWEVEGIGGKTVVVEAALTSGTVSERFDTVVVLASPCGEEIARNDNGGARSGAWLVASLPADAGCGGPYRIAVTSGGWTGRRPYTMEIREVRLLRVDRSGYGSLSSGGRGIWAFDGTANERIAVEVQSPNFDTMMALTSPHGEEIASDDDGGSGTNSRLDATLPEDGRYRVTVTPFGAWSEGDKYTVTVRSQPATTLLFARGRLSEDRVDDGLWTFAGTRGQRVAVEVASADFDPVARLFESGATGEIPSANSGSGGNPRLVATLPRTGRYRVEVKASGGDGRTTGNYTLRVR